MQYKIIESNSNNTGLIKVLKNRGIKDPLHYLNVTDEDIVDPATITNIKEAAKCLVQSIYNNEICFVNVD